MTRQQTQSRSSTSPSSTSRSSTMSGRINSRSWRHVHDARRIGFLAVTLCGMTVLNALNTTPSLAAPSLAAPKPNAVAPDIDSKASKERLATLEATIADLQTTVNAQNKKIAALETTSDAQTTKIATLENTVAAQTTKIASLETADTEQKAQIASLKDTVAKQATEITSQAADIKHLEAQKADDDRHHSHN